MEFKNVYYKLGGIVSLLLAIVLLLLTQCTNMDVDKGGNIDIKVATAAEELLCDYSIVIAGGIGLGKVSGQEGKLRATALVISGGRIKLCIVTCDLTKMDRDFTDEVGRKIEIECGIPYKNILITASHAHHVPATVGIHGYSRDETIVKRLQDAIFLAVSKANNELEKASNSQMYFWLGQELTVGQDIRLLLSDSTINWSDRKDDEIRPTWNVDSELPVISFRSDEENFEALLFNHSIHNIGSRKGGVRSPAFYGLAAQDLEEELGGTCLILLRASGSGLALKL